MYQTPMSDPSGQMTLYVHLSKKSYQTPKQIEADLRWHQSTKAISAALKPYDDLKHQQTQDDECKENSNRYRSESESDAISRPQ